MPSVAIAAGEYNKDLTIQGPYAFPLSVHENDPSDLNSYIARWHWHDEVQYCYVIRGEVDFYISQNRYRLKVGQGIFINQKCIHMSRSSSTSSSAYMCIDVDLRLMRLFPGSAIEQRYINPFFRDSGLEVLLLDPQIDWQRSVLEQLKAVCDLYRSKVYGYEIIVCSSLFRVLHLFIDHCGLDNLQSKQISSLNNQRLRDILKYVYEHYTEKISLREIAHNSHLSPGECCRFFKRSLGCTVFDYILECRIGKSIDLLSSIDIPIVQVAYESGFCSTSYFTKIFRAKTSFTPREYRQKVLLAKCK